MYTICGEWRHAKSSLHCEFTFHSHTSQGGKVLYFANVSLSFKSRVFVKGMPAQSRSQTIILYAEGKYIRSFTWSFSV